MELLRTITLYIEDKDMPFLIIGGHAVNAYGLSRQTGDLDLLVRRNNSDDWDVLLKKLNYSAGQSDDNFARYSPKTITEWPVDLMFVDDETFEKMNNESSEAEIGLTQVRVASARHLATLKIHALKTYQEHRYTKDYNDLIGLLRSGQADFSNEELKEICLRYANLELYDKIQNEMKEHS